MPARSAEAARLSEMPGPEYDRMAQVEADHWWYRTLRALVADVFAQHGFSRGTRVLDAGCGTGGGLAAWARAVAPIGLDISPFALRWCARRGLRPLVMGTVEALPFRSASIDAVVTLDVLCLSGIDATAGLLEIRRVLRPGGLVIVNLPAFEGLRGQHDEAVRVHRRYRKDELARTLAESGFTSIDVRYWNSVLFAVALLVRKLRHRTPELPASSDLAPLPGPFHRLIAALLRFEGRLLSSGPPFGTSVFAVAQRPDAPGDDRHSDG